MSEKHCFIVVIYDPFTVALTTETTRSSLGPVAAVSNGSNRMMVKGEKVKNKAWKKKYRYRKEVTSINCILMNEKEK